MIKIALNNLFIIIIILLFISCHSSIDTEHSNNNYFKIKDVEFKNIVESKIKNLDNKNGFKNIYLESNFSSYNFSPTEWEFNKKYDGKIIEITCNLTSMKIHVNHVQLESIKLIFYDSLLALIDINCLKKSNDVQYIFEIFKAIYGYPTDNLIDSESILSIFNDNYESEFEYKITKEQTEVVKSDYNNLNSELHSYKEYSKDNTTGEYFSTSDYKEYIKGWEGKNVIIKYYYKCLTKEYYGKLLEEININDNPKYSKIESSERFIIMSIKSANEILNFLKKCKTDEKEKRFKEAEERQKKEFNKL